VLYAIVKLVRIASMLTCLIVAASFVVFAVEQTGSASSHQQALITNSPGAGAPRTSGDSGSHESSARKLLDEASTDLTSPFAGAVSGAHSEWVSRGGRLLLTLAIYGFGVGFLARVLTVRV
jgi:hypothetical protein